MKPMSKLTKQEAAKAALALSEELGPGWLPAVNTHAGCNYYVANGVLQLVPNNSRTSYTAFMRGDGYVWASKGKTPYAAIRRCVHEARGPIEKQLSILTAAVFIQNDLIQYLRSKPKKEATADGK